MDRMDEEFELEEITQDEVDRVVAALEQLAGGVASETIRLFLEECSTNVYYLLNDHDEDRFSSAA
ncbi:MAG: hypothetical protein U0872_03700 [Planctomycetaceae bacterium]